MTTPQNFDFDEAFSRNIGWVTAWEQQILRGKKIAIAGLGGVGGAYLLTLARLGIENFHIADLDTFELANFNRQAGAMVSTLTKSKVETLSKMARDINPNIKITEFTQGITPENLVAFLKDIDLYVDGLDFFVLELRQKIFMRCQELKIPAITVAPLGMGVAYEIFMPGQMGFDEYYGFDPKTPEENSLKFLLGLNPLAGHRFYLIDPTTLNLKEKRGPSTIIACNLCAGVVGAEALKILLKRGQIFSAPWFHYFDAYRNVFKKGYLRGGSRNFFQQLRLVIARGSLKKLIHKNSDPVTLQTTKNDLETILDLAKWAPSGDNSQPWQFEIKSDHEMTLLFHNEDSAYDFVGKPSTLTIGFFIETFKIAAQHFKYRTDWTYESVGPKSHKIHFKITKDELLEENPLFSLIKIRSVNRFAYKTTALTEKQKELLAASLGEHLTIRWFENFSQRLTMTRLTALATNIRLSIKETYATHKHMIDFKNNFSPDRVPIKAAGLSLPTQKLMEFSLKSWERVDFMNKFLGAAVVPQLEMDLFPGILCAGHYIIEWKNPKDTDDILKILAAGEAVQRFWLVLTQLGFAMQPSIAPIAFAYYSKNKIAFTQNLAMQKIADKLANKLEKIVPINNIVFMGRVGMPPTTLQIPRSVRKELKDIIKVKQ